MSRPQNKPAARVAFVEEIRRFLVDYKLSQEELGKIIHKSGPAISSWLTGNTLPTGDLPAYRARMQEWLFRDEGPERATTLDESKDERNDRAQMIILLREIAGRLSRLQDGEAVAIAHIEKLNNTLGRMETLLRAINDTFLEKMELADHSLVKIAVGMEAAAESLDQMQQAAQN